MIEVSPTDQYTVINGNADGNTDLYDNLQLRYLDGNGTANGSASTETTLEESISISNAGYARKCKRLDISFDGNLFLIENTLQYFFTQTDGTIQDGNNPSKLVTTMPWQEYEGDWFVFEDFIQHVDGTQVCFGRVTQSNTTSSKDLNFTLRKPYLNRPYKTLKGLIEVDPNGDRLQVKKTEYPGVYVVGTKRYYKYGNVFYDDLGYNGGTGEYIHRPDGAVFKPIKAIYDPESPNFLGGPEQTEIYSSTNFNSAATTLRGAITYKGENYWAKLKLIRVGLYEIISKEPLGNNVKNTALKSGHEYNKLTL